MTTHCRLTILANKNPKLSVEEFHKYWSEEHSRLWLKVPIVQEKITDYSQFHTDPDNCKTLAGLGLPITEYDGIVSITANSLADLMAVFADPEYQRIIVPDEEYLFDRAGSKMLIGYELVKKAGEEVKPGVLPNA